MSTGTTNPNGAAPTTPEELEREVEHNREELARTVDALHHKLDVKAQAKQRAGRLKDAATTETGKPSPALVAGLGAVLLGAAVLVWRRRH